MFEAVTSSAQLRMEIALPQCAFGDVEDQPSAPSSPTQCLSVTKCTSPRSCCTRALAEEQRQQLSHYHPQHSQHPQHQHSHSHQPQRQERPDAPLFLLDAPSIVSVPASSADAVLVSSPTVSLSSAVLQRLLALNTAYALLDERVHEESKRPLLGAQARNMLH